MKKNPYIIGTGAVMLSLLAVTPAFAHEDTKDLKAGIENSVEVKLQERLDKVTDWYNKQKESGKTPVAAYDHSVFYVDGIVTATSSNSFTVKGKNGKEFTVLFADAAAKSSAGVVSPSQIKVNDIVFVTGSLDNTTVKAETIFVGTLNGKDGEDGKKGEDGKHGWNGNGLMKKLGGVAAGIVTSINGDVLTITSKKNGTTTVTTSSSTTYRINGEATSSAAVGVGSHVVVSGTSTGTTTASAGIVDVFSKGFRFIKHVCFGWMHK